MNTQTQPKLRYTIGQIYIFSRVNYTRPVGVANFTNFVPWQDVLKSVDFYVMRCESHHKVPLAYGSTELNCDGFVFKLVESTDSRLAAGSEWYNQYPRAHYQQTSDDNNYYLLPADLNAPAHVDYVQGGSRLRSATHHLDTLLEGIEVYFKGQTDHAKERTALQDFYEHYAEQLKVKYGAVVKRVPLTDRRDDGTDLELPVSMTCTVIEWDRSKYKPVLWNAAPDKVRCRLIDVIDLCDQVIFEDRVYGVLFNPNPAESASIVVLNPFRGSAGSMFTINGEDIIEFSNGGATVQVRHFRGDGAPWDSEPARPVTVMFYRDESFLVQSEDIAKIDEKKD